MFGPVQSVAGARRLYAVKDRVVVHQVLDVVRAAGPPCLVHTLQWRDMSAIDFSSIVIAVNPSGRQIHLVLSTLGTRSASFIVHAPTGTVDMVPLRFSRSLHEGPTVLRCTMCAPARLLVVNDVCGYDGPISRRLGRIHDIVHSEHVPDAALFPLQVVARRNFSMAQLSDVKSFLSSGPAVYHSLSLIGGDKELRVPITERGDGKHHVVQNSSTSMRQIRVGDTTVAPVVAAHGPDAYKVQVSPSDWHYVAVKTIEESAALARLDLRTPKPCQLAWDGSGWRIVLGLPAPLASPMAPHPPPELGARSQ